MARWRGDMLESNTDSLGGAPPLRVLRGDAGHSDGTFEERWPDGRRPPSAVAPGGPRVSVVIAALNEEKNLPYVLARLPDGLHEVILVDGHSTDDTIVVARRLRPGVRIVVQSGRGK